MTAIWVEWDDESGDSGAARWSNATDAQIDESIKAITKIMDRNPDTTE